MVWHGAPDVAQAPTSVPVVVTNRSTALARLTKEQKQSVATARVRRTMVPPSLPAGRGWGMVRQPPPDRQAETALRRARWSAGLYGFSPDSGHCLLPLTSGGSHFGGELDSGEGDFGGG